MWLSVDKIVEPEEVLSPEIHLSKVLNHMHKKLTNKQRNKT